jgi:hypothetical protein
MNRKLSWLFTAVLFVFLQRAEAQQPKTIPRIGYLSAYDKATEATRAAGVLLLLRELGYLAI